MFSGRPFNSYTPESLIVGIRLMNRKCSVSFQRYSTSSSRTDWVNASVELRPLNDVTGLDRSDGSSNGNVSDGSLKLRNSGGSRMRGMTHVSTEESLMLHGCVYTPTTGP